MGYTCHVIPYTIYKDFHVRVIFSSTVTCSCYDLERKQKLIHGRKPNLLATVVSRAHIRIKTLHGAPPNSADTVKVNQIRSGRDVKRVYEKLRYPLT